jgi:hypothetical protein
MVKLFDSKIKKIAWWFICIGLLWGGCREIWTDIFLDEVRQVKSIVRKSKQNVYIEKYYPVSSTRTYTGEISIHNEQDFLKFVEEVNFTEVTCEKHDNYLLGLDETPLLVGKLKSITTPCSKRYGDGLSTVFFKEFIAYEKRGACGDGMCKWMIFLYSKNEQKTYFFSRVPHVF